MFLKRIAGLGVAAALAAGGFLVAAPAASASTGNLDDVFACFDKMDNPHDDLFWAAWNAGGGAPFKEDVLGHIAAARPLVAEIQCTDDLQPRIAGNLAIINTELDSATLSIAKDDWQAAKWSLDRMITSYSQMFSEFDDLIYG